MVTVVSEPAADLGELVDGDSLLLASGDADSGCQAVLQAAVDLIGGTVRRGQEEMVGAVASAIESQTHLLVQAGTGTGKSLGYLVPAAVHVLDTGDKVLVSTGTLALQRQLITRDLPVVAQACAAVLGREPTFAVLKGWRNYLCKYKVGGGYPSDDKGLFALDEWGAAAKSSGGGSAFEAAEPETFTEQVRRLTRWSNETATGDRDDLVPGVSDRAWNNVSVSTRECLGKKCPVLSECFAEAARAASRDADIVVTNHTMLGIATGDTPILPEHDVLIVDEAHELADRVTSAATVEISALAVSTAARQARRHGKVKVDELDKAAMRLSQALSDSQAEYLPDGVGEALQTTIVEVRDAARGVLSKLKPAPDKVDPGLKLAQAAVEQIYEVAAQIAASDPEHDVTWVTRPATDFVSGGRGRRTRGGAAKGGSDFDEDGSRLYCAPLHVSYLIGGDLLETATGIFTSATLTLGGDFSSVVRALGLGRGDDNGREDSGEPDDPFALEDSSPELVRGTPWRAVDVGSPFAYPQQGILYVAAHLPAPGRDPATDAQLDVIAELIEAAGGRTLGLFTSWRAAEAAAEAMRERLKFPVLLQGDDQTPTLVAQFLAEPEVCLFGTRTLWQGVDLPGESCQLVLIDRIPFPRPDEPLTAARSDAAQRGGRSGFMAVSIPQAALLLAQGAGRLIRTTTDRGVVAVLDPRLTTARYGSFLRQSMPHFWQTNELSVATAALRRLRGA